MKTISRVVAVLAVLVVVGCKQPFGARDNPIDEESSTYQGYRVVGSIEDVAPESPAAGASITWLEFVCSECEAADLYAVRITDPSGSVLYTRDDFVSHVLVLDDAWLSPGTYAWSVRAHKQGGEWAEAWSTGVTVQLAEAVGEPSPAGGESTIDTTPLLEWADVEGAASYEVQVADGEAGLTEAASVSASVSEYQVPLTGEFAYGETCYWRVRVLDGDGRPSSCTASLSAPVSWDLSYEVVSPADGRGTFDTTPLLEWGAVSGAARYEVQIADSEAGLDAASAEAASDPSHQVAAVLAYGTWYWRERAVNDDGVVAPAGWSAAWSYEVDALPVDFLLAARGTFDMGSTEGDSDELPVHSVTISEFAISMYEVTQADYLAVVGSNPSTCTGDTSRPVEQVSWYDAVAYCNVLSAAAGLGSCYNIEGDTVSADWTRNGYRLPTEAEWEYAARGGTVSQGYTYSGSNTAGDVAWYSDNSGSTTHPVGAKDPNELGIHDMSGNVMEWCWDWGGATNPAPRRTRRAPRSARAACFGAARGAWRKATLAACDRRAATGTAPRPRAHTTASVSSGARDRSAARFAPAGAAGTLGRTGRRSRRRAGP